MRKIFLIVFLGGIMVGCNEPKKEKKKQLQAELEYVDIPFYTVDTVFLDRNILVVELIDSTKYLNPTVSNQAIGWYSFHMYKLTLVSFQFDSIRINRTLPIRDSINTIYTNTIERKEIANIYKRFNKTRLGNFTQEFLLLNWKTRDKYKEQQSCLLDRVNSVFAWNIDSSYYKVMFPNNSTWFGIDCFSIFEMYFNEILEGQKSVGHEIVREIEKSTGYIDETDKVELLQLIQVYTEQCEDYRKPRKERNEKNGT